MVTLSIDIRQIEFMRKFFYTVLLSAFAPLSLGANPALTTPRPPNVIVILADDLGYGDVSANGEGKIHTRAIDDLARQGVRMTSGYSAASTCTPSRYALMTGEYPWRKTGTGILPGDAALIISPTRLTLPRIFKNAGYTTGAVGKWHLGMGNGKIDFNQRISPGLNELGFDYAFHMAATGDRVPSVFLENGRVVNLDPADPISVSYEQKVGDWPTGREHPEQLRMKATKGHDDTIINGIGRIGFMSGGRAALWQDQSMGDTFNAKAMQFIHANKERPFFLYYAAHEPHVPRDPNPRFVGMSGVGARGDAVLQFDDQVARLLATLREEGLEDQTLVLLSSDNGPVGNDGYDDQVAESELRAGHHANGTMQGGKYTDFEGGVRMPFIARWPGHIKPGTVCGQLISQVDLMALAASITDQSLASADAPDSIDPLPALTRCVQTRDRLLFGNPSEEPPMQATAIRVGDWKLINQAPVSLSKHLPSGVTADTKDFPRLFNLRLDLGERINVARSNPEIVKRLSELLTSDSVAGFTRPGAAAVEQR